MAKKFVYFIWQFSNTLGNLTKMKKNNALIHLQNSAIKLKKINNVQIHDDIS